MWRCPKCHTKVDDSFEVCWSCGTTPEGVEDPNFLTADQVEPEDLEEASSREVGEGPAAELAGDDPLPDLVECYMARDVTEAQFIANELMQEGVPAVAGAVNVNMMLGGFQPQLWGQGPAVRVRPEDLPRARAWVEKYEARLRARHEEEI
jgi:hypothetical protein